MRRLAAFVLAGLMSACTSAPPPVTGPEVPSPVPVTVNPSGLPIGDTMPTSLVAGNRELILYFAGPENTYWVQDAWRDRTSGAIQEGGCESPWIQSSEERTGHFFDMHQCRVGAGRVIEFGAVGAEVSRITVTDGGRTVDAHFARWSRDPRVTMYWLQRDAKPIPDNVPAGEGGTKPLAEERYPLLTAYDATGKAITTARFRPRPTVPRTDG